MHIMPVFNSLCDVCVLCMCVVYVCCVCMSFYVVLLYDRINNIILRVKNYYSSQKNVYYIYKFSVRFSQLRNNNKNNECNNSFISINTWNIVAR